MAEQSARPLSPHLSVWRWGPAMTVSILHRISGGALTVVMFHRQELTRE